MKASIDAEGVLQVNAETEIESYALRKWCEEHANGSAPIDTTRLVFRWGNVEVAPGED